MWPKIPPTEAPRAQRSHRETPIPAHNQSVQLTEDLKGPLSSFGVNTMPSTEVLQSSLIQPEFIRVVARVSTDSRRVG